DGKKRRESRGWSTRSRSSNGRSRRSGRRHRRRRTTKRPLSEQLRKLTLHNDQVEGKLVDIDVLRSRHLDTARLARQRVLGIPFEATGALNLTAQQCAVLDDIVRSALQSLADAAGKAKRGMRG